MYSLLNTRYFIIEVLTKQYTGNVLILYYFFYYNYIKYFSIYITMLHQASIH